MIAVWDDGDDVILVIHKSDDGTKFWGSLDLTEIEATDLQEKLTVVLGARYRERWAKHLTHRAEPDTLDEERWATDGGPCG